MKAITQIKNEGLIAWVDKIYRSALIRYRRKQYNKNNAQIIRSGANKAMHCGVIGYKNAGDTLLFQEVENCFSATPFVVRDIHEGAIEEEEVQTINASMQYLLLGGGGLFIKDTNPNSNSSWQFDISTENLNKLSIPLILFAVGYNRFRDQEEFDSVFGEHLVKTVEKAEFIGLRNHGSIKAIKSYLPEKLWDKISYQPCPTTIMRYQYPAFIKAQDLSLQQNKKIVINIAFDRADKRFGDKGDSILQAIIGFADTFKKKGWTIIFVGHVGLDRKIIPLIKGKFQYKDLTHYTVDELVEFYAAVPLTVGMRGHAQMVPFGLGNMILSLISHDKMRWFLNDIKCNDWGVEVSEVNLEEILVAKASHLIDNYTSVRSRIEDIQKDLKQITDTNVAQIKKVINDAKND